MKPAAFDYHRPASRGEALKLLADNGGDAKPLAGGQSLIPAMNFRLAMPAVLVDLNAIADLSHIKRQGNELRIGAMTRHRTVERSEDVRAAAPLLHEAMPFIAHAAIRTRGTIGGSLAHADPAAELPAVMIALGAKIRVESVRGSREGGGGGLLYGAVLNGARVRRTGHRNRDSGRAGDRHSNGDGVRGVLQASR
jgi:CO/xanthine dehydrogenase FAD-binding subunit